MMRRLLPIVALLIASVVRGGVNVTLDTGEAEAVLAIADRFAAEREIPEESWTALFATNGYRDLKARETAMGRDFADDDFRKFVLSDAVVGRRRELRKTLDAWKRFDLDRAAERALSFLPAGSSIRATVYPLIKPKPNSFVFATDRGKAIFLYLDPAVSGEKFLSTVIHEMHHIGFDSSCGVKEELSNPVDLARRYLGGFGEGIAVLAAAGGASTHPHAVSSAAERAVWDRDVKEVSRDMKRLEKFFLDLAQERLVGEDEIRTAFMSFIATEESPQGAFYTVGWHMAATIERSRGREALRRVMCDRVAMMRLYNEAVAGKPEQPRWSKKLLKVLER
jgi:hypothetical protein